MAEFTLPKIPKYKKAKPLLMQKVQPIKKYFVFIVGNLTQVTILDWILTKSI